VSFSDHLVHLIVDWMDCVIVLMTHQFVFVRTEKLAIDVKKVRVDEQQYYTFFYGSVDSLGHNRCTCACTLIYMSIVGFYKLQSELYLSFGFHPMHGTLTEDWNLA
jgi:hypothetical protein